MLPLLLVSTHSLRQKQYLIVFVCSPRNPLQKASLKRLAFLFLKLITDVFPPRTSGRGSAAFSLKYSRTAYKDKPCSHYFLFLHIRSKCFSSVLLMSDTIRFTPPIAVWLLFFIERSFFAPKQKIKQWLLFYYLQIFLEKYLIL